MSDAALWVCARCHTTNSVNEVRCVVCEEPHPGMTRGDSTVFHTAPSRSYPAAPAMAAAPGGPIPASGSGPGGGSGMVWALVAVFAVLILVVAVLGAVVVSRSGTETASPASTSVPDSTTTALAPAVAPTTATTVLITAPPTTARASAERAPAGTPDPALDALDLAQELATALAHDDWGRVRALEPAKSAIADGQFASQYGDLDESTAILVSATEQGGGSYVLRLGLVAHQNGSQTSLYCVTWVANTRTGTVTESSAGTRTLMDHGPGVLDPISQADRLRTGC